MSSKSTHHGVSLCLLVGAHCVGHLLHAEASGQGAPGVGDAPRVVVGVDERDLRPFDLAREVAHREAVYAEADGVGGTANELRLLGHDLRQLAAHHLGPEIAELAQRSRVKGARLDAARAEPAEALPHLARRARREGHREHRLRVVRVDAHPVRDAVRDGASLAGAGAREYADGTVQGGGYLTLLGIERVEDLFGGHHVHCVRRGGHASACPQPSPTPVSEVRHCRASRRASTAQWTPPAAE